MGFQMDIWKWMDIRDITTSPVSSGVYSCWAYTRRYFIEVVPTNADMSDEQLEVLAPWNEIEK